MARVRAGSGQAATKPVHPEQSVRTSHFYLGYDQSGALTECAHINGFMRRTAQSIIDDALDTIFAPAASSTDDDDDGGGSGAVDAVDSSLEESEEEEDQAALPPPPVPEKKKKKR